MTIEIGNNHRKTFKREYLEIRKTEGVNNVLRPKSIYILGIAGKLDISIEMTEEECKRLIRSLQAHLTEG